MWLWRPKHWKFGSRWVGPYKIAGRQGVNYTLMLREGKTLVAHHNQLKIGLATSELGLPIHPVAETPGISVQEYDVLEIFSSLVINILVTVCREGKVSRDSTSIAC